MSDIVWWASVALYAVCALAVGCLGTFGISATKADRIAAAHARHPYSRGIEDRHFWTYCYGPLLHKAISATLLAAVFWPVAIPLYLSWKKGAFINDALEKRAALVAAGTETTR